MRWRGRDRGEIYEGGRSEGREMRGRERGR